MKGVRTSTIQLYKIIVRCEQRDGPPRPSAHHVTGRLKKKKAMGLKPATTWSQVEPSPTAAMGKEGIIREFSFFHKGN